MFFVTSIHSLPITQKKLSLTSLIAIDFISILLIRNTYRYTRFPYPFRNAIQFLMSGLLQIMVGRFTVDGINHHLTGSNLLDSFQPGKNKFIGCIIHILSFITSFEKHGLDNAVPFERFHSFYNLPDGIMSGRTVKYTDILFIHRIQASNTAGRWIKVELLSTLTFAFGK